MVCAKCWTLLVLAKNHMVFTKAYNMFIPVYVYPEGFL